MCTGICPCNNCTCNNRRCNSSNQCKAQRIGKMALVDIIDCCETYTFTVSQTLAMGSTITCLHNIDSSGLAAVFSNCTLTITGNLIGTFIVNGIETEVTFPVRYANSICMMCTNTLCPQVLVGECSFFVEGTTIHLTISGKVVTTHKEAISC